VLHLGTAIADRVSEQSSPFALLHYRDLDLLDFAHLSRRWSMCTSSHQAWIAMALGWLRVDSVLRLAAGQVLRAANRKTVLAQKAVFRVVTLARMRGEAVEVRLVFDRRQMHSGQLAQLARA
jgi:hypothetical protein